MRSTKASKGDEADSKLVKVRTKKKIPC